MSDSSSSSSSSSLSAKDVDRGNRGIPKATFIEDVVAAVGQSNNTADALLQQLQALYG